MRQTVLAELEADLRSVDLRACSADELASLTTRALAAQRVVAGYVNRLAGEARRREAAGTGPPADEVLRSGGAVSTEAAKRLDRRAGVGEALPQVGAGVDRGEARSENADVLARHLERLDDQQQEALGRFDAEIARRVACSTPEGFARWLDRLVRKLTEPEPELGASEAERQRAASGFWMRRDSDGMWRLTGELDDRRGAELHDVLTRTARKLTGDAATPAAQVDALVRLATRRPRRPNGKRWRSRGGRLSLGDARAADPLHPRDDRPADAGETVRSGIGESDCARCSSTEDLLDTDSFDPGANMGVGYIVDAATLVGGPHDRSVAQTWAGHDVDPATVGQLSCDTDLYAILYDTLGQPTKIGRTRRAATREQRLQLRGIYDRCPIDGTPFGDCEIHHVNLPWEDGGETELANLLPISRAWHRRIHGRGWRLTMDRDRCLTIWRPDGQLHRAIPPPRPLSRE